MLSKARLVKKQTLEKEIQATPKKDQVTEMRDRVLLTQQIVQTTKDWLASHRQQQKNARQTFAALFMNSDTQSNTI
ncbi:MAG: hypothetical protein JST84_29505 [Acidobacteria bacterium]|nr:hypothetical protein [Acidobacteriota bacterium]